MGVRELKELIEKEVQEKEIDIDNIVGHIKEEIKKSSLFSKLL